MFLVMFLMELLWVHRCFLLELTLSPILEKFRKVRVTAAHDIAHIMKFLRNYYLYDKLSQLAKRSCMLSTVDLRINFHV